MPRCCARRFVQGKLWAAADPERRPTKRAKDELDLFYCGSRTPTRNICRSCRRRFEPGLENDPYDKAGLRGIGGFAGAGARPPARMPVGARLMGWPL
jgi:hypothetical protein